MKLVTTFAGLALSAVVATTFAQPAPAAPIMLSARSGPIVVGDGGDPPASFACEDTHNTGSLVQATVSSTLAGADAGDCVVIPSGTATWSSTMNIPSGVILMGAGGGWIQGSSSSSLTIGTGSKSFTIRASTKLVTATNSTGSSAIFGFTGGETVTAHVKYNSSATMTGTVTSWNGTTLVLNISSVAGSGTFADWIFEKQGATRITHTAGTINITKHSTSLTGLADFQITDTSSGGTVIDVGGNDGGAPFIIAGMQFRGGGWSRLVEITPNGGLVYKSSGSAREFQGSGSITPGYGFRVRREEQNPPGASWQSQNSTMGTLDTGGQGNVYFEDNYFHGFDTELTDFEANARVVFRHSVLDNAGATTHGWDTGNFGGVRQGEVYNNLHIFDDNGASNDTFPLSYFWYVRGGPWVFIDNESDDINSSQWGSKREVVYTIQNLRRSSGTYPCWNSGYPAPHQIGQGHLNGVGGEAGENYVEGFHYYSNTGTMVFGDDDYSPDGCGGGPAVSTYVQAGRDLFTTTKSGYTKYTYPHPLRHDQ